MFKHVLRTMVAVILMTLLATVGAFASGQQEEDATGEEDTVELEYVAWDVGTSAWDWFEDEFEEFEEENPNITINTTGVPVNEYRQVVLQQVLSGNPPDLVPMFSDQLLTLYNQEYLEPLDPYIEDSELNDRLLPVVREVAEIDGNLYAVLRALPPWMLHVNMGLLNEAGIEDPPSSIEELYETTQAVTENTEAWGYAGWFDTSDVHNYMRSVLAWLVGFGGHWTSEPGILAINQEANVEAMQWLRRFKNEELMPTGISESESYDLFSQERIAMMISGTWLAGIFQDNNPSAYENLEVVRVPMPAHGSLTGGGWLGIPAASENKDEAWQLIEHLYSSESQVEWVKQSGRLGSTTDLPDEEWIENNAPWLPEMREIGEQYVDSLGYDPIGFEEHSDQFKQRMMPYVLEVMNSDRPVADILDEAQADLVEWAESIDMPQ